MYDLFDTFLTHWYDDSEYNKKAPESQQAPAEYTEPDEDRCQRTGRRI